MDSWIQQRKSVDGLQWEQTALIETLAYFVTFWCSGLRSADRPLWHGSRFRVGHAARTYYAGPGNAFWRTLFKVGLTPRLLQPTEYDFVPQYGPGTDGSGQDGLGFGHYSPTGAL